MGGAADATQEATAAPGGALCRGDGQLKATLCLYREKYYLKAAVRLSQRPQVRRTAEEYGTVLGACPVLYAYCEEYGRRLSADAVKELGGALWKQ